MNESYFEQLRSTATGGRLNPESIRVPLLGSLAFSGVVTLSTSLPIKENLSYSGWNTVANIEIIGLIIQAIITLFFLKETLSYKFQKFQLVFATIIVLKLSLETYLGFFLLCETRWAPDYLVNTGKWLLIGGLVYLIISTIRALFRVKNGHLQKGGKGLYNFQQSTGYVSLPIIFGVVAIGSVIYKNLSSSYFGDSGQTIYMLVLAVLLQYAIAMAIPEFFLIIYCKFKFPSFKAKMRK